jgi:hypothetical protein
MLSPEEFQAAINGLNLGLKMTPEEYEAQHAQGGPWYVVPTFSREELENVDTAGFLKLFLATRPGKGWFLRSYLVERQSIVPAAQYDALEVRWWAHSPEAVEQGKAMSK